MIRLIEKTNVAGEIKGEIELTFELRQRSRFKTATTLGEDVGVFVERGSLLRDGELLMSERGDVFRVIAKAEPLSVVRSERPLELARAAYHLGNRHVRLQVTAGCLAYQPDHVLDRMVEQLGLTVTHEELPFEPENGAYHGEGSHGHGHGEHSHGHTHGEHLHSHSHADGAHSHSHDEHAHPHSHDHGDRERHLHIPREVETSVKEALP